MADIMTTSTPTTVTTPPPSTPPALKKKKKKKRGKVLKNILVAILVLALAAGAAFFIWKFAFEKKPVEQNVLTDFATRSSISNMISGSGSARATKSSTITLGAAGKVQEVFVADGDPIKKDDPLFVISSETAQKAVDEAIKRVGDLQKDMDSRYKAIAALQTDLGKLQKELSDIYGDQAISETQRYITAPFAGQMRDSSKLKIGDEAPKGTKLGLLVDDSKFKLSLYFSYAYEGQIKVGQAAQVSITSSMTTLYGTVESVNMVRKVAAEGATLFEAVLVVDNPGALQEGTVASATLTATDGTPIYPYSSGKLAYYRTAELLTKTTGKVISNDLLDFNDVAAGQNLMVLDHEDFSDKLEAKNSQIESKKQEIKAAQESALTAQTTISDAQKKVEDAKKALENFSAKSPMDGTVVSCTLLVGEDVESGRVAVTIADTSIMTIDVKIDERNVSFVKPGMSIDFRDWNGNMYNGTVESVSLQGKSENGVTTFPAVVKVENSGGTLMNGMGLDYEFAAASSTDCIVIPIQCVRYISDTSGDKATVVFLKAEEKPANAMELSEEIMRDVPAGFYPVPVTIGLSDSTNVEITEGLDEGAEIYTISTAKTDDGMGGGGSMGGSVTIMG